MALIDLRKSLKTLNLSVGRFFDLSMEVVLSLSGRLPVSIMTWAKIDLLRTLIRRDLEGRYKGSVLGNLWPLVNQVAQLLIYTYVFSIVLKVKLNLTGLDVSENLTFGLWIFAGLLPWNALSNGLAQSANSVTSQPNLVKKVVFPLELLPLVPVLSAFVESAIGVAVLIILVAIFSGTLHPTLVLLPVVWLPQLLFTAGLSYLAAGLTVFLRDIPQALVVVLNLWMYATPIFYPISSVPEGARSWLLWLNPVATIVEIYRDLILVGKVQHGGEWAMAMAVAVVIAVLGWSCYGKVRPAFADVL
jgi:lipopolysaccharide transport system permease protein